MRYWRADGIVILVGVLPVPGSRALSLCDSSDPVPGSGRYRGSRGVAALGDTSEATWWVRLCRRVSHARFGADLFGFRRWKGKPVMAVSRTG